jgi:hypothetical protein
VVVWLLVVLVVAVLLLRMTVAAGEGEGARAETTRFELLEEEVFVVCARVDW